jgi:hypothetical protein
VLFVALGSYQFLGERLRMAWISGETLTRVAGPLALSLMVYRAG